MLTPVQSQRYAQLVNNFNEKEFYAYYAHLGEGGTVEDFFEKMEKHGEHDQQTHGNWADGSQGSVSELSDSDIQDILQNTKTVEGMYQKVAERLGKTLKPKVEVIPEGEENLYRGLSNLERDAEQLVNGKIPFTPMQTWGQGIYATPDKQDAGSYGQVVRMKLDSKAKILRGEPEPPFLVDTTSTPFKSDFIDFPKLLPKITRGEMDNFSLSDAYNIYHASKGYDGYQPHGGEIVLFNGTHLTVNRTDIGTAVQKHQEHDQSTHGNWATGNFNEEEEYESAMSTYSERYGVNNTGARFGMTEAEHRAIDDYSQNGYRRINQFLRGSTKDSDLDKYDAIAIVLDNERMNEVAIEEWQVKNEVADDYEMSASDLEEAAYQYAFSGKHAKEVLAVYFEGKSPRGAIIKNDVKALDSLIDKSPSLFGDKTLYRVYSNNTLSNLQEGDIVTDKGFLSTTRIDITQEGQSETRNWMGDLSNTPDTVGIILPNENKSGKGLAIDIYRTVIDDTSYASDREKEILLPRNTPLKFIGYKTDVGMEARVAVFQRLDK